MVNIELSIVEQFQGGDRDAFLAVYESLSPLIYGVVYNMVRNPQDAEDRTHDLFIKIFDKRKLYKKTSSFESWVKQVAFNHVLNVLRRRKWLGENMSKVTLFYRDQVNSEDQVSGDVMVSQCLSKLDAKYRLPLILKEMESYSYEEIAETLGLNIGTVRSRLNRAKKQFREMLIKKGVTHETYQKFI